jgi:riboflavin kinase/FMN adenylyltransferase
VLDRNDLELYGVEVEVSFFARLRGMTAFDSVDDLVAQMHDDVEQTRRVLDGYAWYAR